MSCCKCDTMATLELFLNASIFFMCQECFDDFEIIKNPKCNFCKKNVSKYYNYDGFKYKHMCASCFKSFKSCKN